MRRADSYMIQNRTVKNTFAKSDISVHTARRGCPHEISKWLPVLANVVPGVTVFLMISAGSAQKDVDSPSANPDTIHLPSAAASVPDNPNSPSSHDVHKCIERTVQNSVPGWRRSKTADPS